MRWKFPASQRLYAIAYCLEEGTKELEQQDWTMNGNVFCNICRAIGDGFFCFIWLGDMGTVANVDEEELPLSPNGDLKSELLLEKENTYRLQLQLLQVQESEQVLSWCPPLSNN